ncbi:hypothetical protein FGO68_gene12276 [Halteria grandinella]|uniref:Uncharacterized protein n=1 Tax=Halteria grandinella TaxID=5974 RepID=A0A8J8T3E5_HALGN|nr:hypothetical protein FGO68_gene12276 [Halteria grandinella]
MEQQLNPEGGPQTPSKIEMANTSPQQQTPIVIPKLNLPIREETIAEIKKNHLMNSSVIVPTAPSLSARITNSFLNVTTSQELSSMIHQAQLQTVTPNIPEAVKSHFRKHLVSNILESIKIVAEKFNINEKEAFLKIFKTEQKPMVREKAEGAGKIKLAEKACLRKTKRLLKAKCDYSIRDFVLAYAQVLHEQTEIYIQIRDDLDISRSMVSKLQDPKLSLSLSAPSLKAMSKVSPEDDENVALTIIIEQLSHIPINGDTTTPSLTRRFVTYVYFDEEFTFKTKAVALSSKENQINFNVEIESPEMPDGRESMNFKVYEIPQDFISPLLDQSTTSQSDHDIELEQGKLKFIGQIETQIDHILLELLFKATDKPLSEQTYTIEEELFQPFAIDSQDHLSRYCNPQIEECKELLQQVIGLRKPTFKLSFKCSPSEDNGVLERLQEARTLRLRQSVSDFEKIQRDLMKQSQTLKYGVENLFHIRFDPDDGLLLDQRIDGEDVAADKFNESINKSIHGSISSRTGTARSTITYQERLKAKNLIELERYEHQMKDVGQSNQRICGGSCGQLNCIIF